MAEGDEWKNTRRKNSVGEQLTQRQQSKHRTNRGKSLKNKMISVAPLHCLLSFGRSTQFGNTSVYSHVIKNGTEQKQHVDARRNGRKTKNAQRHFQTTHTRNEKYRKDLFRVIKRIKFHLDGMKVITAKIKLLFLWQRRI